MMMTVKQPRTLPSLFNFTLPDHLSAHAPSEARGIERDKVRLLVSDYAAESVAHTRFDAIADLLEAGDVLVINTSRTLPAALPARIRAVETAVYDETAGYRLHLSTEQRPGHWIVELRQVNGTSSRPYLTANSGDIIALPNGGYAKLDAPFSHAPAGVRLWQATLTLPRDLLDYLAEHGEPIRYDYVSEPWPLNAYQTVYGTTPGSAEMPSAGRAFSAELITRLVARGVIIAPVLLHTGVASLEADEPPYAEYFAVSPTSARLINMARTHGKRVIAVGTTAVRAVESVTDDDGTVFPGCGWTDLVITPERRMQAVTGLLTGFHEPKATHLSLLAALGNLDQLERAYHEALEHGYLWHEFGDLHLILDSRT